MPAAMKYWRIFFHNQQPLEKLWLSFYKKRSEKFGLLTVYLRTVFSKHLQHLGSSTRPQVYLTFKPCTTSMLYGLMYWSTKIGMLNPDQQWRRKIIKKQQWAACDALTSLTRSHHVVNALFPNRWLGCSRGGVSSTQSESLARSFITLSTD